MIRRTRRPFSVLYREVGAVVGVVLMLAVTISLAFVIGWDSFELEEDVDTYPDYDTYETGEFGTR